MENVQHSTDVLIAQKRAEIAAKVDAMRKSALGTSSGPAPSSVRVPLPSPTAGSTSSSPGPSAADDLARRVAEARRRVAEAQSKLAVKDNPYMVRPLNCSISMLSLSSFSALFQSIPQSGKKNRPVEPAQQGAGLKMAAHPLLLDNTPTAPQSKKDRYKPMQPKFASIKACSLSSPFLDRDSSVLRRMHATLPLLSLYLSQYP